MGERRSGDRPPDDFRWHGKCAAGRVHLTTIGDVITLADIQIAQGCLREAMSTYQLGLHWATAPGAPVLRGAADMYVGLSSLCYEHNDLAAAAQHLFRPPVSGRACRVAAKPIPLVRGDGAYPEDPG